MYLSANLQAERTNADKVGKLLDELERRGPNTFSGLLKAFEKKAHEHAAKLLIDTVNRIEASNDSRVSDGNILSEIHCVPEKRPPFYYSNNSVKN